MRQKGVFAGFLSASLIAAAILCLTTFAAQAVVDSQFYRKSRALSMLLQQDSFGVTTLLSDTRNADLAIKFAGAVTSAYINFELIPLNEGETFVAVFESLTDGITVDALGYRRKTLVITGVAKTQADYSEFLGSLRERDHFATVTGSSYETTNGSERFEIACEVK